MAENSQINYDHLIGELNKLAGRYQRGPHGSHVNSEIRRAIDALVSWAEETGTQTGVIFNHAKSIFEAIEKISISIIANHSDSGLIWYKERFDVILGKSKRKQPIEFDRFLLVEGVELYIDQPVRVPTLERKIIDILCAMEIYAFSCEMMHPSKYSPYGNIDSPITAMHPVVKTAVAILFNIAVLSIFGAIYYFLISRFLPGWVGIFLMTLGSIYFVTTSLYLLFILPKAVFSHHRARSKVIKTLDAMGECYAQIDLNSKMSSKRTREVVDRAAEHGVVWPPSLYLLLDKAEKDDGII